MATVTRMLVVGTAVAMVVRLALAVTFLGLDLAGLLTTPVLGLGAIIDDMHVVLAGTLLLVSADSVLILDAIKQRHLGLALLSFNAEWLGYWLVLFWRDFGVELISGMLYLVAVVVPLAAAFEASDLPEVVHPA